MSPTAHKKQYTGIHANGNYCNISGKRVYVSKGLYTQLIRDQNQELVLT